MSLLDILDAYRGSATQPSPDDAAAHFDQVANQIPAPQLGAAVAHAFRADDTPEFPDMVGRLFGQSAPEQRAGLLNEILGALRGGGGGAAGAGAAGGLASILQGLGGGGLGGLLGGLLNGGGAAPQVTPQQASQVSEQDVRDLAAKAQQHAPGVLDRVAAFYGQHPMIVRTLGAVALSAVMRGLGQARSR